MKIVITSGYFDPIHVGHIELFQKSKALGDRLLVIVNNDQQAILKKGKEFMPFDERLKIIESLRFVDMILPSIDEDLSVNETLKFVRWLLPNYELILTKGGDWTSGEIREKKTCDELGIKIIDGLGDKIQSSSWLTNDTKR